MFPDHHADYPDRLPRPFRDLIAAAVAAGWDYRVSSVGPFRVGDVHREVVEVAASTRAGHRVRAWWCADAPPGEPRPPFRPCGAFVGQGRGVGDAAVTGAVAYVREHWVPWQRRPG